MKIFFSHSHFMLLFSATMPMATFGQNFHNFYTGRSLVDQTQATLDSAKAMWIVNYSGPKSSDDVADLAVDGAGNIYIAGESQNQDNTFDYVTVKYNSNGIQQWTARYDFSGRDDNSSAMTVDGAGNVYVTGTSDGGGTLFDIATIKYNSNGAQQWLVRYNGTASRADFGAGIALDNAGNVYVAGSSRVSTGSQLHYDIVVIHYNASGVQQRLMSFNHNNPTLGNSDDFARLMALDKDGNIYLTGTRNLLNQIDIVTLKYNSAGVLQWAIFYGGPGLSVDEPAALAVDQSGSVYIAGTSRGSGTGDDIVLLKYSAAGVEQWVRRYTGLGSNPDDANDMVLDDAGNIYVTGSTNVSGNNNFVTIKYSPGGNQEWIAFYDSPARFSDGAHALTLDRLGNVYVTGSSMSRSLTTDFLTIKYDGSGREQWVARYSGPKKFDVAKAIAVDGSSNVIVTGESLNTGWTTIKYAQVMTAVEEETTQPPNRYRLSQNYPNPFNPSTSIRFDLPKSGWVTLKVYNLRGEEMATLVNENRSAGSYQVNWAGEDLASGLYFYRLQAGEFSDAKKLIIAR
jgi:uncharacterized delta-60 repeat protein